MRPEIIPAMKVGKFLELYPELEDDLIALSPQFKKLKNPVLRRTVAKIVTLRQAANTGNVPVEHLVNVLRMKVGLSPLVVEGADDNYGGPEPVWLHAGHPIRELDVTDTINAGGTPLQLVMEAVDSLDADTILILITPILPSPIIDKIRVKEVATWTAQHSDTEYRTHIYKSGQAD